MKCATDSADFVKIA